MPLRTIRFKLIVGLSLVIGMMLILLGGSVFGLHSFHISNLTLVDQLKELDASKELLKAVAQLDVLRNTPIEPRIDLRSSATAARLDRTIEKVEAARTALQRYYKELERNWTKGNRADDGRDEFELAFLIDDDLTAILNHIQPERDTPPLFARTSVYLSRHPERRMAADGPWGDREIILARLERLHSSAVALPDKLHRDFLDVLAASKLQYQSSRVIVWTSALMVLAMLVGAGHALPPLGALSGAAASARRASRGPGPVRLPDRPAHGRRDAGPGRGVQRHDHPPQRHLRRPGATGPGT